MPINAMFRDVICRIHLFSVPSTLFPPSPPQTPVYFNNAVIFYHKKGFFSVYLHAGRSAFSCVCACTGDICHHRMLFLGLLFLSTPPLAWGGEGGSTGGGRGGRGRKENVSLSTLPASGHQPPLGHGNHKVISQAR